MLSGSRREFVEGWKRIGPLLEEQRERDIRKATTTMFNDALGGAVDAAVRDLPPRESSGLVEFQRWMQIKALGNMHTR
jgi:hypothetical protein